MKEKTRVFVYGTLKPGGSYHDKYCGNFQFEVREARIKGQLFDFHQLAYPGAQEDKMNWIQGVILTFHHPENVVLPKLDELEGYDPEKPTPPNEYYRKQVDAFATNNEEPREEVWCYFMDPKTIIASKGKPLCDGHWIV